MWGARSGKEGVGVGEGGKTEILRYAQDDIFWGLGSGVGGGKFPWIPLRKGEMERERAWEKGDHITAGGRLTLLYNLENKLL